MAKCPICETKTVDHWMRGALIIGALCLLLGFIAGQLFHSWQYSKFASQRIEKLEDKNKELRDGYVPPRR